LGGELNGKISRLKSFEIGKRGWNNLLVTFPDSNIYLDSLKKTDVFRNGSIGGAILSRFKVIFDFPNEKIYLKKGSNYKKKFFYNMSGIVVKAKGSRLSTFEIVDIRENSSGALAGLKQGDIITSINNIPTNRLELGNIVSMLNEKQNKRLRVEVRRGNENLKVVFRLKNQI
ncbi:MAG: PDZ domain-containing protein, partial [Fulvivirga sp.]